MKNVKNVFNIMWDEVNSQEIKDNMETIRRDISLFVKRHKVSNDFIKSNLDLIKKDSEAIKRISKYQIISEEVAEELGIENQNIAAEPYFGSAKIIIFIRKDNPDKVWINGNSFLKKEAINLVSLIYRDTNEIKRNISIIENCFNNVNYKGV